MPRIVLVGAGSVEFTRNLLGDILTSPALRTSHIALHDIDPERLATAERMARWTADALGADADDLGPPRPARGARGRRLRRQHHPGRRRPGDPGRLRRAGRFGLHYTINDTIGVGGVFRGPADDPRRARASRATWRTSAPTPGSSTTRTRWRSSSGPSRRRRTHPGRRACATRSSGPSTGSPGTSACRARRSMRETSGLNHLAFVLRLRARGRDLYPDLRAFVEAGEAPEDDLVRAELFRRLGAYPTESSEHHAEYNPWYIGKRDANGDAVERFHIPIGEYLDRVAAQPRRVRRDPPDARRGRAVRDRAERRVRRDDRRVDDDRRARPGSSSTR